MEATHQFTVRLPVSIYKQVQDRAEVHRRSANQEIVYILETYIDTITRQDLAEMERVKLAGQNRTTPQ